MILYALTAFVSGLVIGLFGSLLPGIHLDKILIGDIMLMIPGILMTSSVRDVFVGDTITGLLRLVETLLWAAALAVGIMISLTLIQMIPSSPELLPKALALEGGVSDAARITFPVAVVQLITGALGSLGFSMMFHVRSRLMLWTTIGGIVCWGVYLIVDTLGPGIFLPCLAASAVCGMYGELLARALKVPGTVLFIPSMIPLIPGGSLYYTMAGVVQGDWASASFYGGRTVQYVLAIAVGISIVWAFFYMLRTVKMKRNGT